MAKRTGSKTPARKRSPKATGSLTEAIGNKANKDILRELISNPAVQYVASGIAMAVLTRLATKMSERYPELSNLIKENLDTVEGKLNEFRGTPLSEANSRH